MNFFIQKRFLKVPKKSLFGKDTSSAKTKKVYNHVVQIGDPCLRGEAQEVTDIKSNYVQEVCQHLRSVIKNYDAVGLAAPQVGIPLKIACVQFTKEELSGIF